MSNDTSPAPSEPAPLPYVDYLELDGDTPRLVVNACTRCAATFFDRRNACAHCGATEFMRRPVANEGRVRAFTVVERAGPETPTPFIAVVVDCDGVIVRANLVGVPPTVESVSAGQRVRLTTYPVGTDDTGRAAVCYGFTPIGEQDE